MLGFIYYCLNVINILLKIVKDVAEVNLFLCKFIKSMFVTNIYNKFYVFVAHIGIGPTLKVEAVY